MVLAGLAGGGAAARTCPPRLLSALSAVAAVASSCFKTVLLVCFYCLCDSPLILLLLNPKSPGRAVTSQAQTLHLRPIEPASGTIAPAGNVKYGSQHFHIRIARIQRAEIAQSLAKGMLARSELITGIC